MGFLKAIDRVIGSLLRWGCVAILGVVFVLLVGNVFIRFVPVVSFGWFDEIVELLIAWMVFLGAAALWRENEHFAITFLPDLCKGKPSGFALDVVINVIGLVFIGVFFYYSLNISLRVTDWTPVINLPKSLLYASMPVSSFFMVLYSLRNIVGSAARLIGAVPGPRAC